MIPVNLRADLLIDQAPKAHPLDAQGDWERYDLHITERNKLIDGKRQAEDNFVKTVIQLSSAIALLVPGFVGSQSKADSALSMPLIIGLFLIFLALLAGLSEQFLSSVAYNHQIKKTDLYYSKKTSDTSPPAMSKIVAAALIVAFSSFLAGVVVLSIALLSGVWR